jgi:hypothetical protein
LVNADDLADFAKLADTQAFSNHLDECDADACVFSNLDKSSILIAPKNILEHDVGDYDNDDKSEEENEVDIGNYDTTVYGHLANFLRGAPTEQITEIWRMAALAFSKRLEEKSPKTVWFSTSGSGVAWLHFRLDSQPKYYQYQKFANEI